MNIATIDFPLRRALSLQDITAIIRLDAETYSQLVWGVEDFRFRLESQIIMRIYTQIVPSVRTTIEQGLK